MLACTDADWKRIRAVSATIGRNPDLVQGAGGNVSLKHDGVLWVKASGKWLADAATEEIFVPVALGAARKGALAGEDDFGAYVLGGAVLRPSIETGLHALLPQRLVLHVHSVNVLCHAVLGSGERVVASLLAGMPWHWVPYARPGAPLTRTIEAVADVESGDPLVLVLANHGLVIAANRLEEIQTMLASVERALQRAPRAAAPHAERPHAANLASGLGGRLPKDESINRLAMDPAALEVARLGPLYPDHVVFLGAGAVTRDPMELHNLDWDELDAPYVILPKVGVIVRHDISANAEAMLGCWAALAGRIDCSGQIIALPEGAILELLGWDAEKYRQALARSSVS